LLEKLRDADIDGYLDGSNETEEKERHEHSKAAYAILKKYAVKVDRTYEADVIDWDKPIMWQGGNLGDRYWQWIHEPIDVEMRLLKHDWMEALSRNNWYAIPGTWLPLVAFLLYLGWHAMGEHVEMVGARVVVIAALFGLGILGWTLLEYTLHRYLFHWEPSPKSYNQITAHFILHGIHHKTPMDPDRLVFPPALALLGVGIFYTIYASLFPWHIIVNFASGQLFGYICYDVIHYYLHHGQPSAHTYYAKRKAYHQAHHYKEPDLGYGISTLLWDGVFNTMGTIAHSHSH